jgi:DNA-directed RNA polymerase subunit RPC12/RpoP
VSRSEGPAPERDCVDCGAKLAMKLQNVPGVQDTRIPLWYVCAVCKATLRIPPLV